MDTTAFAKLGIAVAATVACLAGSEASFAQDSADVTVEVGDCIKLESPEERRACYAARVDAAVQERERSAATAAPPASDAVRRRRATRDGSGDPSSELVATISALRETVPNSYLITLDDGQTWRQMRSKWFPLRVGQEVRIYPTNFGASFRLSVQGLSGYIQVERVR